ncbi:unnamed protein product [Calypogeia fissa]
MLMEDFRKPLGAMGSRVFAYLLLGIQLVCLLALPSLGQLSNPVAHDDNMKHILEKNKFMQREATDDLNPVPQLDEEALVNTECPQNLELRWQSEVGSSIYATPLISDINGDGKLEVVIPTFVHYLEVLEGSDGEKLTGWPVQHQSTVHASALMYDIDNDGNKEIAVATFNGEVLFYRSGGYLLPEKLIVPKRKVQKDWYVGLNPDPVDRSKPDVHDESLWEQLNKPGTDVSAGSANNGNAILIKDQDKESNKGPDGNDSTETKTDSATNENVTSTDDAIDLHFNSTVASEKANERRRRLQVDNSGVRDRNTAESNLVKGEDAKTIRADQTPTVEDPDDPMEEDARASFDVFRDEDENGEDGLTEEYAYDYDDYVNEDMWGEDGWDVIQHHEKMEKLIEVDSHILTTPVIADIDKDGVDEMVIAVSYFYDNEYYESSDHAKELGENLDLSKYVAGAIVVFNLETKHVKWELQLDLSTDSTTYRAYIYSPPTVVDLDGDGYQEIIVGTSMGFVYAINHAGKLKKNFPLQMGEIQGQVVAADINDDGKLELVTTDSSGNVAAWTGEGQEIWEVHLKSLISQGPTVGDVDGDGHTELVVPTSSGNIYVLKGSDGSNLEPYPFRTHGRVMAPALLVDLSRREAPKKGLTIAVGSFDGYFYLIDGPTGCAEAIDIGETSYSMALADNVDGGDDLDIIVTTMNGNVYCFQTPALHHPLKAWPMQTQGRNVFASRYQREGVFVLPSSRMFRDEAGDTFHVTFEIVDKHVPSGTSGPYDVTVSLLTPGNYRGDKRSRYNSTYEDPGVYHMALPCLSTRTGGTVVVEMLDKNSLYFSDEFSLTFHMHYYQLLKWLLTLPLFAMTCMFLLFPPQEGSVSLPSFTRERYQL